MSKFIIESVITEKSAKDIKTGVDYKFSDGLNLICGNNELGKSSLMNFIKDGFFREKGVDTGKIYFSILGKKYRADIKDARSVEQRLKIYDENNSIIDYDFITANINRKYFEQGFYITLDDLMSVQKKDTNSLLDVIKDPSCEQLADFLDNKKLQVKNIFGDNSKLTKETAGIKEKIAALNMRINELSNIEAHYNSALNSVKMLDDELKTINEKEKFFNIEKQIKELNCQIDEYTEQYGRLKQDYNEKLFADKENYLSIIRTAGRFDFIKEALEKNKNGTDLVNSKIASNLHILNTEYAMNIEQCDLNDFTADNALIKQIKDLLAEKDALEKEIIKLNSKKENEEENLLKLKHDLHLLNSKDAAMFDINELKNLYSILEDGINKYNFSLSQINNNTAQKFNILNQLILIFSCILFVSACVGICIGFIEKKPLLALVFLFAAFLPIFIFYGKNNSKIKKEETLKNEILSSMKDKLKNLYPEICDTDNAYLPFKLDGLKRDIQNKIQKYNELIELIEHNKSQTNCLKEKLDIIAHKTDDINAQITLIRDTAEKLINSNYSGLEINSRTFLDTINILKTLKEDINEKNLLLNEFSGLSKEIASIINAFENFYVKNGINISFSEKYEDNILLLKSYNDKNSELKSQLDILNTEIQSRKNKIMKLENEKKNFSFFECTALNINEQLDEICKEKDEKLNLKQKVQAQRLNFEKFEGLNDLKLERSILLDEYRKKIFELVKNKMVISLIETAKNSFDKIQPNIKSAQKYFALLTDNKYTSINLDLREIQNNEKQSAKKWNELSRGTKEQLYLALRLGYASNYSKNKKTLESNGKANLPLIIDDAFVNFDPCRTKNAFKCLLELSETNQILFFTCHSETIERYFDFEHDMRKINIINM